MSAEPDLLPLPEIERWRVTGDYAYPTEVDPEGGAVDYDAHIAAMQSYASANVAHATAPLQAEIDALRTRLEDTVRESTNKIEALRAEVEGLTQEVGRLQQQYDERTACVIVHRGSALSCSDAMRTAYSDERCRADKLAEALRGWWKAHRPVGWTEDQNRSCPHVNLATDAEKALATALLRDQEEGE